MGKARRVHSRESVNAMGTDDRPSFFNSEDFPGNYPSYDHLGKATSRLLELYRLNAGRYELEIPNPEGQHWIAEMGLFLGTWRGDKADRSGDWLRWWDANGNLLPWAVEQIEQERQRANRLAEYLRLQGIDPDQV